LFRQTISDGGRSGNALASEARESMEAGPGAPDGVLQAACAKEHLGLVERFTGVSVI
jgi:hypothetical protein